MSWISGRVPGVPGLFQRKPWTSTSSQRFEKARQFQTHLSQPRGKGQEPVCQVQHRPFHLILITSIYTLRFPFYWWGHWGLSEGQGPAEVCIISDGPRNPAEIILTSKSMFFQPLNRKISVSKSVGQILDRPILTHHKSGPLAFYFESIKVYILL